MSENEKPILVIDSQEIDNFGMCPFRHHAIHDLHLQPREPNLMFERGGLLHDILEQYYTLRRDTVKSQAEIIEECVDFGNIKGLEYTAIDPTEVAETIFQFREYARYYENETWIPLFIEQPFLKELYEDSDIKIMLAGKPDLIIQYAGTSAKGIVDHKRMSRKKDYSMIRNQFMLYATALEIDTIVVNKVGFQKTLKAPDRFLRQTFTYYPEQLEEWKWDTIQLAKEMLIANQTGIFRRERTSCEKFDGCFLHNYCQTRPEAREFLIGTEYVIGPVWDVTKKLEEVGKE